jgi:hypothetical protein
MLEKNQGMEREIMKHAGEQETCQETMLVRRKGIRVRIGI